MNIQPNFVSSDISSGTLPDFSKIALNNISDDRLDNDSDIVVPSQKKITLDNIFKAIKDVDKIEQTIYKKIDVIIADKIFYDKMFAECFEYYSKLI